MGQHWLDCSVICLYLFYVILLFLFNLRNINLFTKINRMISRSTNNGWDWLWLKGNHIKKYLEIIFIYITSHLHSFFYFSFFPSAFPESSKKSIFFSFVLFNFFLVNFQLFNFTQTFLFLLLLLFIFFPFQHSPLLTLPILFQIKTQPPFNTSTATTISKQKRKMLKIKTFRILITERMS